MNNNPQIIPTEINKNQFGLYRYKICIPSLNITTVSNININNLTTEEILCQSTSSDILLGIRKDNNTIYISANNTENNNIEVFNIEINHLNKLAKQLHHITYTPPNSRENSF